MYHGLGVMERLQPDRCEAATRAQDIWDSDSVEVNWMGSLAEDAPEWCVLQQSGSQIGTTLVSAMAGQRHDVEAYDTHCHWSATATKVCPLHHS